MRVASEDQQRESAEPDRQYPAVLHGRLLSIERAKPRLENGSKKFLAGVPPSAAAGAPNAGGASGAPATSPVGETSGPPLITINGGNPATNSTNSTHSDLGATITGPQPDLDIHTFVDGIAINPVVIDTSTGMRPDNVGMTPREPATCVRHASSTRSTGSRTPTDRLGDHSTTAHSIDRAPSNIRGAQRVQKARRGPPKSVSWRSTRCSPFPSCGRKLAAPSTYAMCQKQPCSTTLNRIHWKWRALPESADLQILITQ
jgi:hypothetical protein